MDNYDVDDSDLPKLERDFTNKNYNKNGKLNVKSGSMPQKQQNNVNKKTDSEEQVNKRPPRPKLDYERLLRGNRGLGYLAVCTKKSMNLSGQPGREAHDLGQIVTYLHEWSRLVFPKMPLAEFLLKVEELCQSRLMKACIPEIMKKLEELGDTAIPNDLEDVSNEFMTRMATDKAEKALKNLENPESESLSAAAAVEAADFDFNLDELLANKKPRKNNPSEYADNIRTSEDEQEYDGFEDDEHAFNEEMNDFINDNSDGESSASGNDSGNDSEEEAEGIESASDIDTDHNEQEDKENNVTDNVEENDFEFPIKKKVKRGISLSILESDDDE